MKVRATLDLQSILASIGRYYTDIQRPDIGERKVRAIFLAIRNLAQQRIGHRADSNLPVDYRRMNVEDYAIFYRVLQDHVLVCEVRHASRRPLKPITHKRKASSAERRGFEVN
jgi:plasmid stabilization system protein ParE